MHFSQTLKIKADVDESTTHARKIKSLTTSEANAGAIQDIAIIKNWRVFLDDRQRPKLAGFAIVNDQPRKLKSLKTKPQKT